MGRKVHTFHQLFQKLQICLLRGGQSFYIKTCRGRKVSLGGLRPPTSNPTLKNLKFGTPWASYGCFGDHLSAFEVEKINRFLQGVDTAVTITEYPIYKTLKLLSTAAAVKLHNVACVSKIKDIKNFMYKAFFGLIPWPKGGQKHL